MRIGSRLLEEVTKEALRLKYSFLEVGGCSSLFDQMLFYLHLRSVLFNESAIKTEIFC
jgi:hypothetical protein